MGELLIVRVSQLNRYVDCARSQFLGLAEATEDESGLRIRSIRKTVAKQGHVLAEKRNSIAAAQGTALHAMMAEVFKQKLGYGQINLEDAFAAREKAFTEEICKASESDEGIIWDATTRHFDTAKAQLLAMCRALLPIAELTNPLNVEDELSWDISPLGAEAVPIRLIGHRDLRDTRYELHDHKTGLEFPPCHAQMGGYAILTLYNGQECSGVRVNYTPRLPMSRLHETQALTRSLRFNMETCMQAAWAKLKQIQTDYMRWLESGSPSAIPTNAYSQSCTKTYCEAFDSSWCGEGKISG